MKSARQTPGRPPAVFRPAPCVLHVPGAKQVIAVEANPEMADLARDVVAVNGFDDNIFILQGCIEELASSSATSTTLTCILVQLTLISGLEGDSC